MATVKLVCGDCGAALTQNDRFCPRCGARAEGGSPERQGEKTSVVRCKACGREVRADANCWESCGASLRGGGDLQPQKQKTARKGGGAEQRAKQVRTKVFEPWKVVTGAAIVIIVAFFVYTELTREREGSVPAAQENVSPPPPEMMQEIEQVQRTVDANPTDATSLLRLANMLHDAAMHSPMLLNRAINAYTKYLALRPADPNARVDMGICYFEMARIDTSNAAALYSRSIQEMQTAFKSNPSHQPAAFNLGIVNLNAGNIEEARTWFKKAVDIDPNSELGKKAQQMLEQHLFPGQPN